MTADIFLLNSRQRPGFIVLRVMPKTLHKQHKESIGFLLVATALTIVISYMPFGEFVVYPLRLFVTFIHEGGHALAALLTLGSVHAPGDLCRRQRGDPHFWRTCRCYLKLRVPGQHGLRRGVAGAASRRRQGQGGADGYGRDDSDSYRLFRRQTRSASSSALR